MSMPQKTPEYLNLPTVRLTRHSEVCCKIKMPTDKPEVETEKMTGGHVTELEENSDISKKFWQGQFNWQRREV